ncbi:helix-turn-helix transcriptional regulator [Gordonia insulae]|uniref:Spore germination protein GerE n=1 Tax=Gordonia insulae TaxID=2420509 RepID=A0A3G8JIW6_9ACTN|nr:helix-turn-helix transcriptional regulator [Gordonia insulae]AZG44545.1 Spore germination protein GerE [Gordonia insulae]
MLQADPSAAAGTSSREVLGRSIVSSLICEPRRPTARLIVGLSGYGKTHLLHHVRNLLRDNDLTVASGFPDAASGSDVLLIDDIDRLDDADLAALTDLVDRGTHIVIAATRPRRRRTMLRSTVAALTRDVAAIRLGTLSCADVGDAVARYADPGLAPRVHELSAGMPCLVDAAVGSLTTCPDGALLDVAVAREIRERLGTCTETELMVMALITLGVDVGTTDLSEVLGLDFECVAEVLDMVRCSGFLDGGDVLTAEVHRQCAATLGYRRIAQIERSLDELFRRSGTVSTRLSETLCADGVERSVDARLDEVAELIRAGTLTGVGGLLDALWPLVDDEQRLRATDLAAVTAQLRGDTPRAACLAAWAAAHTCTDAIGIAVRARWAVIAAAGGGLDGLAEFADPGRAAIGPETSVAVEVMIAQGLASSMFGSSFDALHTLIRAAGIDRECVATRVCADTAAATAALLALHTGNLKAARTVLSRTPVDALPASHRQRRRVLLTWVSLFEGDVEGAAAEIDALTEMTGPAGVPSRDALALSALRVAIARRRGDEAEILAVLPEAIDVLGEYSVDVFGLMFVGEIRVAAAQVGWSARISTVVGDISRLIGKLGTSSQWSVIAHWHGVHAAINATAPAEVVPAAHALAESGRSNPYAAVLARAGRVWIEVLAGDVNPERVACATRELDAHGHTWDAARLAGQAALCARDTRTSGAMLQLARSLRVHVTSTSTAPAEVTAAVAVLSEREREVARLLLSGITYRDIGARLFISAKTVEHHAARIRRRIGADTRSEMLTMLRAMHLGQDLAV